MAGIQSLLRKSSTRTAKLIALVNEVRCGSLSDNIGARCTWVVNGPRSKQDNNAGPPNIGMRFQFVSSKRKSLLTPVLDKEQFSWQELETRKRESPKQDEGGGSKSKTKDIPDVFVTPFQDQDQDAEARLQDSKELVFSQLRNYSQKSPIELQGKIPVENVIVEFGSPNIAKPLHMGHLRSTVTGHYVTRICRAAGHKVTTICYLGDWGTQFGVLHAGLSQWLPRDEDVPLTKAVHKLSLSELLDYYVKAVKEEASNEAFAGQTRKLSLALEKQERTAIDIWATVREKTINHLGTVWNQLGISYDVIQGESEFAIASDHTEATMKILKDKANIVTGEDGCVYANVVVKGKMEGTEVQVPLVKADGSSLYLLRDIAAARSRLQRFKFDRMMYVVDKSQEKHFTNLFSILSEIGLKPSTSPPLSTGRKPSKFLQHISFGRVDGMSTRSGNFVSLSDAINDGTELMEDTRVQSSNTRRQEDEYRDRMISTNLAISALVVNSLKQKRSRDYKFDWVEALRPNGDTGVRLQYTHARLYSLEQKQTLTKEVLESDWDLDMDYIFQDPHALDLALMLLNFEDAFWASYKDLEPCILLTYIFKLCDRVSKCLKELKVQTEPNQEIAKTRLRLFMLSRKILAFGLDTVGIEPMNEI